MYRLDSSLVHLANRDEMLHHTKTMAQMKPGRIVEWNRLSDTLSLFRVIGPDGESFPTYQAGQYIALRRDECLLTRKVKEGNEVRFVPDLDEQGNQKRGPVTHSYSIASPPFETARDNYLEFYVVLERDRDGVLGRFTESLFRGVEEQSNDRLAYVERIVGDFTLAKRAAGFEHVLMVGTGTGVAPFVSMIKQLHFEAERGAAPPARYTLIHANRTREELAYHRDLLAIEKSKAFDFVYLASVSRPTASDPSDEEIGTGRANNLLRRFMGLPPREEGALAAPPRARPLEMMQKRIDPARTVILTCGNPLAMADIAWIAAQTGTRFEKEDW
jgi:ferredoxin-NADP reductase